MTGAARAEIQTLQDNLATRASEGSGTHRAGVYDHHARVLRQARARLAASGASAGPLSSHLAAE